MLIEYKNETIEKQIQLIEDTLKIECVAYSICFNPRETMYVECAEFENEFLIDYLRNEKKCLGFCTDEVFRSLFHKKYVWNFLMFDFYDTLIKYKRNKFLYFYDKMIDEE